MSDRRRDIRVSTPFKPQTSVTLRPGNTVTLVDAAPGGVLVHSTRPLRPGGRVHVTIATDGESVRTAAQVVRCAVASIDGDGVTYAAALAFETRCQVSWEAATRPG